MYVRLYILSSFFHNLFETIRKIMKDKVEESVRRLIKVIAMTLTGVTFLLLGVFHLIVGVVKYFTLLFGSEILANCLMGGFLVLVGLIILLVTFPRK